MSMFGVGAAATGMASLAQIFLNTTKPAAEETPAPPAITQKPAEPSSTEQEFLDYARMSVAERLRKQILESKGFSEEDLAGMDSEKRATLEKEIAEAIREKLLKETGKETGGIANILA